MQYKKMVACIRAANKINNAGPFTERMGWLVVGSEEENVTKMHVFAPQKWHCAASVHLRTYLVPRELLSHYGTTKKHGLGSICDTTLTSTFLGSVVETDLDQFPNPNTQRAAWLSGISTGHNPPSQVGPGSFYMGVAP